MAGSGLTPLKARERVAPDSEALASAVVIFDAKAAPVGAITSIFVEVVKLPNVAVMVRGAASAKVIVEPEMTSTAELLVITA